MHGAGTRGPDCETEDVSGVATASGGLRVAYTPDGEPYLTHEKLPPPKPRASDTGAGVGIN